MKEDDRLRRTAHDAARIAARSETQRAARATTRCAARIFLRAAVLAAVTVASAAAALSACRIGEKMEAISVQAESTWRIAGPFPAAGLSGLEDALDRDYLAESAEAGSDVSETAASPFLASGKQGAIWNEAADGVKDTDGYGGIDFLAEFGPSSYAVAYAHRTVQSKGSRRVELKVGSDDGVKIWLNGELAFTRHVRRALTPGEDAVVVQLKEGANELLVKVEQGEGDWGFLVRMDPMTGEGVPLQSLAAYPDFHVSPLASSITGTLAATPASCPDGEARIELVDLKGEVRAQAVARIGERFSLRAPAGLSGVATLRAVGLGGFAGIPSRDETVVLGDAAALVRSAADTARTAAAAAKAEEPARTELAATLEFLADSVEGTLPSSLGGYNKAAAALAQIEEMTSGFAGRHLEGLRRYAYVSSLDGSVQPYSLYLPEGYDPEKRYGLVVTLHGATGNDWDQAAALAAAAPRDLIIVSPFGRGDLAYVGAGERDVLDVIDLVSARYGVDPDRIYLTGSSMGGFGTWRLAQLHPWRFAAIAPFAGWTSVDILENIAGIPVLAVHGDQDTVVPYQPDQTAVALLASKGADAKFDLMEGVGHSAFAAWTEDGGPGRLLDWFRPLKRNPWPASLMIRTTMARTGKAAWASILGIQDNRKTAGLDCRVVDERRVSVETDNVSAFELDLRHPGLAKGGRILILADGFSLTADSGKTARFELGPKDRFRAAAADTRTVANNGAGIAALFEGPIRAVYGTKRRASAAENEEIARALVTAFEGIVAVEAMSDVEAEKRRDESGDYSRLFVGNPADCPPLARILPSLPLVWEKSRYAIKTESGTTTAEGGLLFVQSDPERPSRLVGLLSLRAQTFDAARFAASLASPLQTGRVNDPCGYKLPDAMLIDPAGGIAWYGYFDWRWKKIEGFAPR